MGVENFPSALILRDPEGRESEVRVADSHIYTAALAIGFEVVTDGYTDSVPKEAFSRICNESAEVGALSKLLNEQPETDLSQIQLSAVLFGYTAIDYERSA